MANPNAIMRDRTGQALKQIRGLTDATVGEFVEDAAKLAAQLVRDSVGPRSTGELANRIRADHSDGHAIIGDADNNSGHGYTAAVDWGYTAKGGGRVKGKRAILRGTMGMAKRWQRGEKWRD